MMEELLFIYLICINILTFLIYGWDKQKARKSRWRISEKTLILLALLGGSPGAYAGMMIFHHKTRHAKFRLGIPVIMVIQVILIYLIEVRLR